MRNIFRYSSVRILCLTIVGLLAVSVARGWFGGVTAGGNRLSPQSTLTNGQAHRQLTFTERVAYQRRIEEVYWRHRLWPAENQAPKPALEAVMSSAAIEDKVSDYLRVSNALEVYWQQPLTAEQLQTEMERMAAHTKRPEALREVWAALDNDPFVIAETLARAELAERLLRNWYAADERFHGKLKQRAESELGERPTVSGLERDGGDYRETEWVKRETPERARAARLEVRELSAGEWQEQTARLASVLNDGRNEAAALRGTVMRGTALPGMERLAERKAEGREKPSPLPAGVVSRLQEDEERYYVVAVLEQSAERLKIASREWRKQPLAEWWAGVRKQIEPSVAAAGGEYRLAAITAAATAGANDTWAQTDSLGKTSPPEGRVFHTVVWTGAEMIVWGGSTGNFGRIVNTGARYNPMTDSWAITTIFNAPLARAAHTAVWTGTEMIIWGGYYADIGGAISFNSGGRYNPQTNSWITTSVTNAPPPRIQHTAVWTGVEMIVWGGLSPTVINITGARYNPLTDSWTTTSAANAPAVGSVGRIGHTAVWTGTEMIVWGGYDQGSIIVFNTGGRYNPQTDTWTPTSLVNAPSRRYIHTAVWTGTEMIVWGGIDLVDPVNIVFNDGRRYNPQTDTWTATSVVNAPVARAIHTAVWTGTEMIVWGGAAEEYLNSGGRYNPVSDAWIATGAANAPAARGFHTAVWTGTEMIVWGGSDGLSTFDSGGRFNPTTGNWTPLSFTDAPTNRYLHTAVWTGVEMIVWGGTGQGLLTTNSGGRYSPLTDSWTATSAANAPSPRTYHTAVWTGVEMIVWGGGANVRVNSGGRYNPLTDSWSATSITNAPTARTDHTAVWAGTEMIVWGGGDADVPIEFNSGGRYNPLTDSWAATSLVNAPTARALHTAVWTGVEMIVWSGGADVRVNSGGRYNPVTDGWTATSLVNAPAARAAHTAVWTGVEMIIWGGVEGDLTIINSGGRYNPLTDSWSATSVIDAPSARFVHTAVWTGAEMIVWGGANNTDLFNTGGRYNPASDGWTATSVANAPSGRILFTAVWTGAEMIVWGGAALDYDTGGRYCACTAPTITPATIVRQQGAAGTVSTIATVGDAQDPVGSLSVTVTSVPAGITVTGLTNTDGTITANVAAAWNATLGINTVGLQVTDGCSLAATANLTVNVTANTCGMTVNPASLPQPYVGVPALQILSASPAGNHTFSVSAGSLPPGLNLVTVFGVSLITGIPTTPGIYNFTIRAKKNGTTCEAVRSYSVTIPATVVPILNCVQRNQNGTWTARFGYDNSTGAAVTIPVGASNYFTPGNQNRDQTTVFQPGVVTNAFSVTFKAQGSNLAVWFLRGPDGVLRPVNVLTTLAGCR